MAMATETDCPCLDFQDRHAFYRGESSTPGTPRVGDDQTLPGTSSILGTAGAAAALAELHGVKSERESDLMDGVSEE